MQSPNRLPRIASIVAFLLAGTIVLEGLLGPIVVLPFALIPFCAGVGIWRNKVWSAYGFATYLIAQFLLVPVILLRPGSSTGRVLQIVATGLCSLGLGALYLFAGRSLAASGARRGRAWPWIVVSALIFVPFLFVQNFEIPSESMENTLLPGDRILAQMFPLRPPARGQLILFLSPRDRGQILIKRVIAVPGDRLRIADKVVILNGKTLDEKYLTHEAGPETFYPEDFPNDVELPDCAEGNEMLSRHVSNGEIVVPAQSYFVLGDWRENSLDSRCWGFVSSSEVVGKPLMIYESIDRPTDEASRPNEDLLGRRRWARLFKIL